MSMIKKYVALCGFILLSLTALSFAEARHSTYEEVVKQDRALTKEQFGQVYKDLEEALSKIDEKGHPLSQPVAVGKGEGAVVFSSTFNISKVNAEKAKKTLATMKRLSEQLAACSGDKGNDKSTAPTIRLLQHVVATLNELLSIQVPKEGDGAPQIAHLERDMRISVNELEEILKFKLNRFQKVMTSSSLNTQVDLGADLQSLVSALFLENDIASLEKVEEKSTMVARLRGFGKTAREALEGLADKDSENKNLCGFAAVPVVATPPTPAPPALSAPAVIPGPDANAVDPNQKPKTEDVKPEEEAKKPTDAEKKAADAKAFMELINKVMGDVNKGAQEFANGISQQIAAVAEEVKNNAKSRDSGAQGDSRDRRAYYPPNNPQSPSAPPAAPPPAPMMPLGGMQPQNQNQQPSTIPATPDPNAQNYGGFPPGGGGYPPPGYGGFPPPGSNSGSNDSSAQDSNNGNSAQNDLLLATLLRGQQNTKAGETSAQLELAKIQLEYARLGIPSGGPSQQPFYGPGGGPQQGFNQNFNQFGAQGGRSAQLQDFGGPQNVNAFAPTSTVQRGAATTAGPAGALAVNPQARTAIPSPLM